MDAGIELGKYSVGLGDRFEQEAGAQLQACLLAREEGTEIVPVWNKSNREHEIIGSQPSSTRAAADCAVQALAWPGAHFVDADHIRLETVDRFIDHCDFFTIDVADWIGKPVDAAAVERFVVAHPELGRLDSVPQAGAPLGSSREAVEGIAAKYLRAVQQCGRIYRHIAARKGVNQFVTEVSLDETDAPQTALDLLVLLAALSDEAVPVQTIAPRFCGHFHKGVDYVGDVTAFERQFHDLLAVIVFAVKEYSLPRDLKLSMHSGSDKFSLYGPVSRALARFGAGLHLKTAGTTWLEELVGIVEGERPAIDLARQIAVDALNRIDELCEPYRTVISIDAKKLPSAAQVRAWSPGDFAAAVRHDRQCPQFNPDWRQLLHVAYKLAAERREEFKKAMDANRDTVRRNVTGNLLERHLKPLFLAGRSP